MALRCLSLSPPQLSSNTAPLLSSANRFLLLDFVGCHSKSSRRRRIGVSANSRGRASRFSKGSSFCVRAVLDLQRVASSDCDRSAQHEVFFSTVVRNTWILVFIFGSCQVSFSVDSWTLIKIHKPYFYNTFVFCFF